MECKLCVWGLWEGHPIFSAVSAVPFRQTDLQQYSTQQYSTIKPKRPAAWKTQAFDENTPTVQNCPSVAGLFHVSLLSSATLRHGASFQEGGSFFEKRWKFCTRIRLCEHE